jgi:hypothetical protein
MHSTSRSEPKLADAYMLLQIMGIWRMRAQQFSWPCYVALLPLEVGNSHFTFFCSSLFFLE